METVRLEGKMKGRTKIGQHQEGVEKVRSVFQILFLFLGKLKMKE